MARKLDIPFDQIAERHQIPRAHSQHACRQAEAIFAALTHLHGLPKTWRPIVATTALLHDISAAAGKSGHHVRGSLAIRRLDELALEEWQRRIVAQAVRLHSRRADVAGFLARVASASPSQAAELGIAGRIAAILRIADGLDHTKTQDTRIADIHDDGQSVRIRVTPSEHSAQNAEFAMSKADLWQRLCLRPIAAIEVINGAPAPPRLLEPKMSTLEAARRILSRQLEFFLSRRYGLPYQQDAEFVHEMRVATRRLRGAMRTLAPAFKGALDRENERLRDLASELGVVRDWDVFLAFLEEYAQTAPPEHQSVLDDMIASQQAQRRIAFRAMLTSLNNPASGRFLDQFHRQLTRSSGKALASTRQGRQPLSKTVPKAMEEHLDKVLRFEPRLGKLSVPRQHKLRIACKRLRYNAEFFSDLYPLEIVDLIKAMTRLQDQLGAAHDLAVYGQRIDDYFQVQVARSQLAKETHDAAIRWIKAAQRQHLRKAQRLWKEFRSPANVKKTRRMLKSAS